MLAKAEGLRPRSYPYQYFLFQTSALCGKKKTNKITKIDKQSDHSITHTLSKNQKSFNMKKVDKFIHTLILIRVKLTLGGSFEGKKKQCSGTLRKPPPKSDIFFLLFLPRR